MRATTLEPTSQTTSPPMTEATDAVSTEPTAPATATPAGDRDRLYDMLRVGALGVVVLWHWVFTTLTIDGTGFHTGNPVPVTPGLWFATWFLQPMPYFFMVGGALHALSYRGRAKAFWAKRFQRLALPALPLVLPALAVIVVAGRTVHGVVADAAMLMLTPMWFLCVYLVLVLLTPVALRAHRAHPVASLSGLVAGSVLIDVARFGHGWDDWRQVLVSFVVVWAAVHQLGFWFGRLRRSPFVARCGVAAVGGTGLAALVTFGPYPHAMVGVPGEQVSNMAPPNLAVIFLALFQLGLITMAERPLTWIAQRYRDGLEVASAWSMTVFVWHLVAWTAFFLATVQFAHLLHDDTVSGGWWLQRPVWLVGPALLAVPLVAVTRRFDGGAPKSPVAATAVACAA